MSLCCPEPPDVNAPAAADILAQSTPGMSLSRDKHSGLRTSVGSLSETIMQRVVSSSILAGQSYSLVWMAAREEVAAVGRLIRASARETLFEQEDAPDAFFVLITGRKNRPGDGGAPSGGDPLHRCRAGIRCGTAVYQDRLSCERECGGGQ